VSALAQSRTASGNGAGRRPPSVTTHLLEQRSARRNPAATRPLPFDPIAEATRLWCAHGWEHAAEGMAAVTSLMRAQAIVQARVDDVLRPLELTFARYELLMLLSFTRAGRLPMTTAGARLQVYPASVTNAATRREAGDFEP
jgi:hypothetical protein